MQSHIKVARMICLLILGNSYLLSSILLFFILLSFIYSSWFYSILFLIKFYFIWLFQQFVLYQLGCCWFLFRSSHPCWIYSIPWQTARANTFGHCMLITSFSIEKTIFLQFPCILWLCFSCFCASTLVKIQVVLLRSNIHVGFSQLWGKFGLKLVNWFWMNFNTWRLELLK